MLFYLATGILHEASFKCQLSPVGNLGLFLKPSTSTGDLQHFPVPSSGQYLLLLTTNDSPLTLIQIVLPHTNSILGQSLFEVAVPPMVSMLVLVKHNPFPAHCETVACFQYNLLSALCYTWGSFRQPHAEARDRLHILCSQTPGNRGSPKTTEKCVH